uniref:Uncharacterized protein n=1 Tax=Anguilla anguilla TaxID=7936 RepID=A0A0E9Q780_ANGAN
MKTRKQKGVGRCALRNKESQELFPSAVYRPHYRFYSVSFTKLELVISVQW